MTTFQPKPTAVKGNRWWQAGLVAAALAVLGNSLLFFLGRALDTLPQSVLLPGPTGNAPLTLGAVVLMSLLPALLATGLLALLTRFVSRSKRIFGTLAALVFAAMFFGPLTIAGAPLSMIVTLELMHVVAAASIVGTLLRALPKA